MQFRTLGRTGLQVSRLGFGGTAFAGFYQDETVTNVSAIHRALEMGINYFDVAPWYTNSEYIFGSVLSQYPRESYYVATKVGRYQQQDPFNFSSERITQSVFESLDNLKVDHIDVIQIHDPEFASSTNVLLNETLPTLWKLKEKGLVNNIGITGYPLNFLSKLLVESSIPIDTILTYSRATLQDSSLIHFTDYFRNVGLINGSINALSLLTPNGPASWHPADWRIKKLCKDTNDFCKLKNVSLPRLSMHYTEKFGFIATNIISTTDVSLLERNVEDFYQPLNQLESEVFVEVEHLLQPIKNFHWENNEVQKYWRKKSANSK